MSNDVNLLAYTATHIPWEIAKIFGLSLLLVVGGYLFVGWLMGRGAGSRTW